MGGKVRSIYGLVAAAVAATAPAGGQSVQYRSAAGVEYRAQRDTGPIARAESALAADPRSVERTNSGIWYHLGIVRYARGDFAAAADAFARAQRRPPDAAELAGATDWLWMSLSRAGRAAEAQAMLDRRPDSLAAANAYAQRLRLYRGEIGPDDVITAADTGDVAVATLSYGVGN